MKCTKTYIDGLLEIDLDIYTDERGFFYEAFNQKLFNEMTLSNYNFVQDNISFSKKNVLRGLHYQLNNSQAKLVQVIKGKIFDVVVDLRRESKTFGNYYSLILSNENKKQLFVPKNFAHGFVTLEEE
ncbi:dTDP-4-dehydrorhamnose 3,5-epimerase, partial [Gammaproteobacteria bacterium]|nr:dTDP-4-dehydrorhamnose 3,5-epimerase [Gammaproteobacteria bacterium]